MIIHLNAEGNRIWMAAEFRGDLPARISGIAGHGWAKTEKHKLWARSVTGRIQKGVWTFPLNYRTCLDIRREFSDEKIQIHQTLWRWAAAERAKREDLKRISEATDWPTPILEREAPLLHEAVHNRGFQSVGIGFMVRGRQAINADEPGLGKTLQAIGAVIESEEAGPFLVVAPAGATTVTWPDEFDAWVPGEEYVVSEGSRAQRDEALEGFWAWAKTRPNRRSWLFINTEMLQKDRPPQMARKPAKTSEAEWYGYADTDRCGVILVKWQLGAPTLPESQAAQAKVDYDRAMEEWDPDARRHPLLFTEQWAGVIVEEGQRVLPTTSSEAKKQSQMRAGAQKLPVRLDGLKYDLTGTPMRGNPLNLWGALNWMLPLQYTGYWTYVDRWFDVFEGEHGKMVEGIRPDVESDYGAELDAVMIRRTKAEVAPWLPRKLYAGTRLVPKDKESPVGVWLDMLPTQKSAYDQMVEDAVAHLENGDIMAAGILAEMTRCKQMACSYGAVEHVLKKRPGEDYGEWVDRYRPKLPSNKWEWLQEWMAERGIMTPREQWGDAKVIVASWQTGFLDLLRAETERLKIPSYNFTGKTSDADRRRAKQGFQAPGGPRLMFLNTYAGGVSLTLDKADEMVVLDETWGPDDQTQLEDRIHRISRGAERSPATYWYVRSRGTIEEHIAATTLGKDNVQKRLMDGRRGVNFAKRLLTGG